MPIELAFSIGVIASVVGAAIYLAFQQLLGPLVEISDDIALEESGGNRLYRIKAINRRFRSLIDIKASLYFIYVSTAPGGGATLKTVENISLKMDYISEIPGFKWEKKYADYAIRFGTTDDLNTLWTGDRTYIRFTIMVSDNYSGIRRVFVKEYHGRHHIKKGVFETGKSMNIV